MRIKTAIILCAGFGKRLHPITLNKPKPLLDLFNKTLLEHTLNLIKKLNIKKVKLNTFYLGEKIENFITHKNFDLEIDIVNEGTQILDTGGGILNLIKNCNEENFLVFNPDTYWNDQYLEDIKEMEKIYFDKKINNILLVVNKNSSFDKKLKGDFSFNQNKLNRKDLKNFVYTGCQILNKRVFSEVLINKFSINSIWDELIQKNELYGFESKNNFIHVTDLDIYQKILKNN